MLPLTIRQGVVLYTALTDFMIACFDSAEFPQRGI